MNLSFILSHGLSKHLGESRIMVNLGLSLSVSFNLGKRHSRVLLMHLSMRLNLSQVHFLCSIGSNFVSTTAAAKYSDSEGGVFHSDLDFLKIITITIYFGL